MPLVCRSAQAKAAAKATKIETTTMVTSNASAGITLLPDCLRHYLWRTEFVIDRDQKPESVTDKISGRSQGLDAGGVAQADTAMKDLDCAVTLQLGEGTADGFDGQAEIVGDVLSAHRKRNGVQRSP